MVRWAVGSWTEDPEHRDSETCKEATIKVQATGGAEGRVFRGKLGGQTTMLSASEDTEVGKEAQRRRRLGWGGPLEHAHSIHTQRHIPPAASFPCHPTWEQWSLWLPQRNSASAGPSPLPNPYRTLAPTAFSRLIPHARLMNNVIKGAIILFLNAF